MDGVRTAALVWNLFLATPLVGAALGGAPHLLGGAIVVGCAVIYVFAGPMLFAHLDVRVWAWRTTKTVLAWPMAVASTWMGVDTSHGWADLLPIAGAAIFALMASAVLVPGTRLGQAFLRATWLPAIDADRLIRETFACACWAQGVEPCDLERTLSTGGDTVHLQLVGTEQESQAQIQTWRAARSHALDRVRRLHAGRLWPDRWFDTMEAPDIGGSFALHQALERGEGRLPALAPSAHERLAIRARHF